MREQRACRVKLLAVYDDMIAFVDKGWVSKSAARFDLNSENALPKRTPLKHFGEQLLLLLRLGNGTNGRDYAEVILRNLTEARIGRGNDLDYFCENGVGKLGAAERLRYVNRPEPALRKSVELGNWFDPDAVAFGGGGRKILR